jgi:hypothetical protein
MALGAGRRRVAGQAYAHDNKSPVAREGIVTAGYFDAFEAPPRSGREFAAGDAAVSRPVAIINESFARMHFPGVDPVGRFMAFGFCALFQAPACPA